mmetsp:Transcript_137469/g.439214  ORF Transcript_137469/g.439214 Transcript_137469/m.439214 type:complete len:218 (-) Transcript_137469:5500-6153(-)
MRRRGGVQAPSLAGALHPGRGVDGVAEERKLRLRGSDDTTQSSPGMDADPHIHMRELPDTGEALGHQAEHRNPRKHSFGGTLSDRVATCRCTIFGHCAGHVRLADGLDLHGAMTFAYAVEQHPDEIQQLNKLHRSQALRDAVKVVDVAEQDRDDAAVRLQLPHAGILLANLHEHVVHHLLREHAGQDLQRLVLRTEDRFHDIEVLPHDLLEHVRVVH